MAFYLGPEWLHSLLLLVMIVLILTGRRSGAFLHTRRWRREQAGLRAALVAELDGLLLAYRLNERLLDAGAPDLLDAKNYFTVYRGNMNRLIGLTPTEAASLAAARAAGDTLDGAVHITTPPQRRRLAEAAWDRTLLDVPALLRAAMVAAQQARGVVTTVAAEVELHRPVWQRLRDWVRGEEGSKAEGSAPGPRWGLRPQTPATWVGD